MRYYCPLCFLIFVSLLPFSPASIVMGNDEDSWRALFDGTTLDGWTQRFRPGDWNEMTVSARGRRVVVHVNGTTTAELLDDPGRTKGHFGLQLHGGQDMDVEFKSIELLESGDP